MNRAKTANEIAALFLTDYINQHSPNCQSLDILLTDKQVSWLLGAPHVMWINGDSATMPIGDIAVVNAECMDTMSFAWKLQGVTLHAEIIRRPSSPALAPYNRFRLSETQYSPTGNGWMLEQSTEWDHLWRPFMSGPANFHVGEPLITREQAVAWAEAVLTKTFAVDSYSIVVVEAE